MHANATFWDDADTDEVETMEQILLGSMVDAHRELTLLLGPDASAWSWGALHLAKFESQTRG